MKTIEIIVAPNGSSKVQTHGFTGATCQQASRFLEQALGTQQSEQLTADYYKSEVQQSNQSTQQQ